MTITNPTVGNHEIRYDGTDQHISIMGQHPNYYSYDAAGWHFVVLNSNAELMG